MLLGFRTWNPGFRVQGPAGSADMALCPPPTLLMTPRLWAAAGMLQQESQSGRDGRLGAVGFHRLHTPPVDLSLNKMCMMCTPASGGCWWAPA